MSKITNALEETRVLATNDIKVRKDCCVLVGRASEIVRKPSTGEVDRHLGAHLSRAANCRDEGALQTQSSEFCEFVIKV